MDDIDYDIPTPRKTVAPEVQYELSENDDENLKITQRARMLLVNTNLKDDRLGDPKFQAQLNKSLDAIDKQILTRKRLDIENRNANTNEANKDLVAAMLSQMATPNVLAAKVVDPNRKIPELGPDIPPPVLVDGETAIGVANMDYETFMAGKS